MNLYRRIAILLLSVGLSLSISITYAAAPPAGGASNKQVAGEVTRDLLMRLTCVNMVQNQEKFLSRDIFSPKTRI